MKWRLGKHLHQHEFPDSKFYHYFNNGKFCPFEEHGCMFKHEHAQLCTKTVLCRSALCQFKHQNWQRITSESVENNDCDDTDDYEEEIVTMEIVTKHVRCNYGLCDLSDILFSTCNDFYEHLQSDHGFEAEEMEELKNRIK